MSRGLQYAVKMTLGRVISSRDTQGSKEEPGGRVAAHARDRHHAGRETIQKPRSSVGSNCWHLRLFQMVLAPLNG